jgi:hypothetical protein
MTHRRNYTSFRGSNQNCRGRSIICSYESLKVRGTQLIEFKTVMRSDIYRLGERKIVGTYSFYHYAAPRR